MTTESENTALLTLKDLSSLLEKTASGEEKIKNCLVFMKASLSEGRAPRFKDYWEAKKICLPLFKENLAAAVRSLLWTQYIEISTEARHLKEILDQESAFAMEQIDLAIKAVETDIEKLVSVADRPSTWCLPEECRFLQKKRGVYESIQSELGDLNNLANQINSLRKEVIRTEMRIRFKNKFFDRLSHAGDKVFPRRKELIKKLSLEFQQDVKEFAELKSDSVFELREEVKVLQMIAKELTIDTQAFTETRLELSKSWDVLKERDKERKKEVVEKQEAFKKNVELILNKIKPLAQRCESETFSIDEAMKHSNEIVSFMKTIDLGRDEVRFLKDEIAKARAPVMERLKKEQELLEKELEESQRQRRDKIEDFKRRVTEAMSLIDQKTIEELLLLKEELQKQLTTLSATHAEKDLLAHSVKEFRDRIIDKKEKALASKSDEERNSLQSLNLVLEEWKAQKQEIRTQLETYRQALAGSGFDFTKALHYRALLDEEKARLDKVQGVIEEIETKIEELENL